MFDDLRDPDIRHVLMNALRARYTVYADALIVPELDIRGMTRVDVSVVGTRWIHGWEIKSDRDTLQRLPHQVELYGRVLTKATLVVTERHKQEAMRMIPKWWGVEIASRESNGNVKIVDIRKARPNRYIDQLMVTGLLWKVETIQLMREKGMPPTSRRGSSRQIQKRMLAQVPFHIIHARVCRQLRKRQGALRGSPCLPIPQLKQMRMGGDGCLIETNNVGLNVGL